MTTLESNPLRVLSELAERMQGHPYATPGDSLPFALGPVGWSQSMWLTPQPEDPSPWSGPGPPPGPTPPPRSDLGPPPGPTPPPKLDPGPLPAGDWVFSREVLPHELDLTQRAISGLCRDLDNQAAVVTALDLGPNPFQDGWLREAIDERLAPSPEVDISAPLTLRKLVADERVKVLMRLLDSVSPDVKADEVLRLVDGLRSVLERLERVRPEAAHIARTVRTLIAVEFLPLIQQSIELDQVLFPRSLTEHFHVSIVGCAMECEAAGEPELNRDLAKIALDSSIAFLGLANPEIGLAASLIRAFDTRTTRSSANAVVDRMTDSSRDS